MKKFLEIRNIKAKEGEPVIVKSEDVTGLTDKQISDKSKLGVTATTKAYIHVCGHEIDKGKNTPCTLVEVKTDV